MFGVPGTAVCLRGTFEKRRDKDEYRFNISSMQLLEEVKNKLVTGLTIRTDVEDVGVSLSQTLKDHLSPDATTGIPLHFVFSDSKKNVAMPMRSNRHINLSRSLVDALEGEEVDFVIRRASASH